MKTDSPNSSLLADPANPVHRAVDIVEALNEQRLSAETLMAQSYATINRCNPSINAICTLIDQDAAMAMAREVDQQRALGMPLPPLAGLPIAIKDLAQTKGLRTTLGSPLFRDNIPDSDSLIVSRLKAAGALVIGKTNTPEMGAGSHTFNTVFGITRNPYNLDRSAGGSSGGAAAALRCGMLALADGSDMGGSLRNPAGFCNVVGLRPSMGRVPTWPQATSFFARMGIEGPMARTVEDCTLLLQHIAGPDPRDPLSLPQQHFSPDGLASDPSGVKIGFSRNPAGIPVERPVLRIFEDAVADFAQLGCDMEEIKLDQLDGAMTVFRTLRAAAYATLAGDLFKQFGEQMKPTLADNIKQGLALSADDIFDAETNRSVQFAALSQLFETLDFLVLPVAQVAPFPVEQEYPTAIEGEAMQDYIDWMAVCCMISPFGLPAASVPAGFDADGLPMGVQIVGRPGDDMGVLRLAYAFQQRTRYWQQQPPELK
ncbi:amidase [Luminiphilus syltensis]|uniref:amidase n=1 Tax=Luminiphilus syltensis TaxID=1341119 RepID=UPI001E4EDE36|nr:amidase [Luminiphilus syltensis]